MIVGLLGLTSEAVTSNLSTFLITVKMKNCPSLWEEWCTCKLSNVHRDVCVMFGHALTSAHYSCVVCMTAGAFPPTTKFAVFQVWLFACATDVLHPYFPSSLPKKCIWHGLHVPTAAQLSTEHYTISDIPAIVTHWPPLTVVIDLYCALTGVVARTHQSHLLKD